jgi:DNA replication protein DnaC
VGGGITILGLMDLLGEGRMENLFFKIKSDLLPDETEVEVKKFQCSHCLELKIDGWRYKSELEPNWIDFCIIDMCNECKTAQISQEVSMELQQKRVDKLISNWWFMSETDTSGFKNFEPYNELTDKAKKIAIAFTKSFNQKDSKGENLLVMGTPGTGKTHLSKAIARTLRAKGNKVGFITAVDLFNKIKGTFNGAGSVKQILSEMQSLDLLIIDDVGVETVQVKDVSWTVKTWTEIIDCRLHKPCIWTSNLDDIKLGAVIGERAFSRMYENTRFIDLFTDDYRKKLKLG